HAVAVDHHEAESSVQQVQVDRMEPATTVVLEVPDLIVSGAWRGVINIHIEEIAIDGEAAARAFEAERAELRDLGRWRGPPLFACAQIVGHRAQVVEAGLEVRGHQLIRNLAGIRDRSGLHPELHDAAKVATLQQVLEDHVGAARIDGEVDHHFVPLGGNDMDTRLWYGRGLQAAVSSDLTERLAAAESKQELASVGAVQEAEAILAALNVHERP